MNKKDQQNQDAENQENQNKTAFSFLLSGEAETDVHVEALDEEELENIQGQDHINEEDESVTAAHLSSRTFGSLAREEEAEEEEEDKGKDDEGEDKQKEEEKEEEQKPKKKVSFKDAFEKVASTQDAEEEEEDTPGQDQEEQKKEDQPDADAFTDQDKAYVETLPEDAQDSLAFWSAAEKVSPEKYKGFAKKQLEYLKAHDAKVEELEENDPDTPVEDNPLYAAWVKKNKPSISATEAKRLEREIIIMEAEERASKKSAKELDELRQWKRQQELEKTVLPKVQQKATEFAKAQVDELSKIEGAEEVVAFYNKALEENGGDSEKATKAMFDEYPDEAEILVNHHRSGLAMAQEFLSIRNGLKPVDVEKNEVHAALANRIIAQEDAMSKPTMKEKRVRDGKTFLPAHEFRKLPPQKQSKHWTFSDDEILSFLQAEVKERAKRDLDSHKKRVARYLQRAGVKSQGGKPDNEDQPRHTGVDAPKSSQKTPAGANKEGSGASRLLNWDF